MHGFDGPVHISVDNYRFPTQSYVMDSAGGVPGYEYKADSNDGNPLGLSWAQTNSGVSQTSGKDRLDDS